MKLNYFVGEIIECRSQVSRCTGWIECEIIARFPEGKVSNQGILAHYRIRASSLWHLSLINEPYMRRKSDSNDASDDSLEDIMKELVSEDPWMTELFGEKL